jgi:fructose-1,6-bisphosphatase/inositol monophosphatase family enzyme
MNHRIELEGAIEAARLAGVYLNAARQGEIRVLSAVGRNIKLQADRESESIILDALRAVAPHPVLAEESGEHDAPGEGAYWVVDPLDGSANFARGVPLCCVAIALMHGEKPLLGVVHDFNRDETLCGVVGEGAWLGGAKGAPIAVASTTDTGQAILRLSRRARLERRRAGRVLPSGARLQEGPHDRNRRAGARLRRARMGGRLRRGRDHALGRRGRGRARRGGGRERPHGALAARPVEV